MDKEKTILKYMQSLKISRTEAEQLYQDDLDDYIGDEGEEYTQKAKVNVNNRVQSDKKREIKRERKIDLEKKELLAQLKDTLELLGIHDIIVKTETELSFLYNSNNYTLKLTKHRINKKRYLL